jgi:putative ABC transport system substrate-binding protein
MRRRFLVAAAWPALAWGGGARAQLKQPILIGWLGFASRKTAAASFKAFQEGLAALGWKVGAQVRIEERWADGVEDRLPSLARELAATKPALIVAFGVRVVGIAAREAPGIPIVMVAANDPIAAGLVKSLARPDGMITGVAGFAVDLAGKHVELLLTAVPTVKRIGFLAYANNPNHARIMESARRSIAQHAVEAHFATVAKQDEIEPAMSRLAKEGAQALIVLPGVLFNADEQRRLILSFALAQRWPVAGPIALASDGGLLGYGQNLLASYSRAAHYVDRILKGAKPGDLPIEQPTEFELVVNLKTAKALGITIPEKVLLRADRVIE